MQCDKFRAAISARIDGEDTGLPDGELDAHLAGCAACRAWEQRAHAATRRARLGGSFLDHDLTARLLAAAPAAAPGRRRSLSQRAGLAAVAIAQLAIAVPLLLLGHDHDAGTHAAHELGSFDLSLAIAFAVGAVRPALSAGLAWPSAIAAAGLTGTAVLDLLDGQTLGADEAQHLIAVAGALLLVWQARTAGTRVADAGTAGATDWPEAAHSSGAAGPAAVSRLEDRPRFPGDGAARATAPDTARVPLAGELPDGAQADASQGPDGIRPSRPEGDGNGREAVA